MTEVGVVIPHVAHGLLAVVVQLRVVHFDQSLFDLIVEMHYQEDQLLLPENVGQCLLLMAKGVTHFVAASDVRRLLKGHNTSFVVDNAYFDEV